MGKNVSVMSGNEHDQHAETPTRTFAGPVNFNFKVYKSSQKSCHEQSKMGMDGEEKLEM